MTESILNFNPERCQKDGLCARVCPTRIIIAPKGEVPRTESDESCVLCGHCVAVCPNQAISNSKLGELLYKIESKQNLGDEVLLDFIRQRRSLRVYKDKLVPRDVLEKVADIACFAPTGAHGGEGWVRNVTIVSGQENMRKVVEMTFSYMKELHKLLDGFVVKAVAHFKIEPQRGRATLHDLEKRVSEYEQGRDIISYNAPAALFVHTPRTTITPEVDCHAAMMLMMLVAQSLELGTCWNGWLEKAAWGFKTSFFALRDFLKIPEDHEVHAAATIGYPGIKLHSVPHRKVDLHWIS